MIPCLITLRAARGIVLELLSKIREENNLPGYIHCNNYSFVSRWDRPKRLLEQL